jgi:hypothetical protein
MCWLLIQKWLEYPSKQVREIKSNTLGNQKPRCIQDKEDSHMTYGPVQGVCPMNKDCNCMTLHKSGSKPVGCGPPGLFQGPNKCTQFHGESVSTSFHLFLFMSSKTELLYICQHTFFSINSA